MGCFRTTGTVLILVCLADRSFAAELEPNVEGLRRAALEVTERLPAKMPGTERDTFARVVLGKKLFNDEILSIDNTTSCRYCHEINETGAGADSLPTSTGATGENGHRNSPSVYNAGFQFAQFWDGRAKDLEQQSIMPILDAVEMAMPNAAEVEKRLRGHKEYSVLFRRAFPKEKSVVSIANVGRVLAAYQRTLITHDRFDDFLGGRTDALTKVELIGLELFLNVGCAICHKGPLLGGVTFEKLGVHRPYRNTEDKGRFKVTQKAEDEYRFKVPMLRNIVLTYPYFHDGEVEKLEEAVQLMGVLQLDRRLSAGETKSIIAFLHTLSGKELKKYHK